MPSLDAILKRWENDNLKFLNFGAEDKPIVFNLSSYRIEKLNSLEIRYILLDGKSDSDSSLYPKVITGCDDFKFGLRYIR